MVNRSKAELHLYIDTTGKSVPPWTPGCTRVIAMPGDPILPILSDDEKRLLVRTGHLHPEDLQPAKAETEAAPKSATE